jgi:hypothetical protein
MRPRCKVCNELFPTARKKLGYDNCTKHGEGRRTFTVAIPYSKGAYQLIHNPADMFITNPKNVRG